MKQFIGWDPGNTGGVVVLTSQPIILSFATNEELGLRSGPKEPLTQLGLEKFRLNVRAMCDGFDPKQTLIGIEHPFVIMGKAIPVVTLGNLMYQFGILQDVCSQQGWVLNVAPSAWKRRLLLKARAAKEDGRGKLDDMFVRVPWKKSRDGLNDACLIAECVRTLYYEHQRNVNSVERFLKLSPG